MATNECLNTIGEAVVSVAEFEVGVHESGGNNHGARVEEYLMSVGLVAGASWCAAFVHWCFRKAALVCGLVNPCPRTASALRLYNLADPQCRTQTPVRGAIFSLDHGSGHGHAGIVESVNDDGTITTIEGNTNSGGSADGDGVYRHTWTPTDGKRGKLVGYVDLSLAAQHPNAA